MPSENHDPQIRQGALDAMMPILETIPEKDVKAPSMPVKDYAAEADLFHYQALEDREALLRVGLDGSCIDSLPDRCAALREAQVIWEANRHRTPDAQKRFKDAEIRARMVIVELLKAMRFAFQDHPDMLARLKDYAKGRSQLTLTQKLNDLSDFSSDYPEPLRKVGFDLQKLQAARDMSDLLGQLEAARMDSPKNPTKTTRDRAYTYLKQAVDQICKHGKFAFDDDPEHQKLYASEYWRK